MRIFLAGGSGLIGTRLIPALIASGHEVVATTRNDRKSGRLAELGATPVVVDVYDAQRLSVAVAQAAADVVLHQLTDLSEHDLQANARLRREGTANLVEAATAAGVERMVVQSIAWIFPDGDTPATERDDIVPGTAVDEMESLVRRMPHVTVLRYGMFYGPGTWYDIGGEVVNQVQAGTLPATPAITSFVHIDDAVEATVQSLDWPDGVYHVVDDEPAAGTAWVPVLAAAVGGPSPQVKPLPEDAPRGRAISNAKARAAGWTPRHPTWRTGFGELGA